MKTFAEILDHCVALARGDDLESGPEGSAAFKHNIATEVKAGKPEKQAVAIAYAKARGDMDDAKFSELKDLLDQFFEEEAEEPEHREDATIPLPKDSSEYYPEESDKAYKKGRDAAKTGQPISSNPYKQGTDAASSWAMGYSRSKGTDRGHKADDQMCKLNDCVAMVESIKKMDVSDPRWEILLKMKDSKSVMRKYVFARTEKEAREKIQSDPDLKVPGTRIARVRQVSE